MNMPPSYFKDIPGVTDHNGKQLGADNPAASAAAAAQAASAAVAAATANLDITQQIASWAPATLTVGELKALYAEAQMAGRAFGNRVPAAVAARARLFAGLVARTSGADGAALTPQSTAQITGLLASLWQAISQGAQAAKLQISVGKTRDILLAAKQRSGGATMAVMLPTDANAAVAVDTKKLPTWVWVLIGLGGLGTLAAVILMFLRGRGGSKRGRGQRFDEDESGGDEEEAAA